VTTPDIEKKKGKRRRSARFYVNANRPVDPEAAALIADFPPDEDDDQSAPPRARRMAEPDAEKRDFTQAQRRQLARRGMALGDGSYPIETAEDLHNAAVLARTGHGDVKGAKKLIARRAKELGVSNPLKEPAQKSYLGEPIPHQEYASRRVSEPLTQGHQSPAVDDHGVGQGRNPGLAAHHGDLRQSSPAAFDAVTRLMTVLGDNQYGDRSITMTAGQVGLSMFNAAGQAGTYDGMRPTARTPVRPPDHIAQGSATPPNGTHSVTNANRPPTQAMKASEARELVRRAMFPGSGGAR